MQEAKRSSPAPWVVASGPAHEETEGLRSLNVPCSAAPKLAPRRPHEGGIGGMDPENVHNGDFLLLFIWDMANPGMMAVPVGLSERIKQLGPFLSLQGGPV